MERVSWIWTKKNKQNELIKRDSINNNHFSRFNLTFHLCKDKVVAFVDRELPAIVPECARIQNVKAVKVLKKGLSEETHSSIAELQRCEEGE